MSTGSEWPQVLGLDGDAVRQSIWQSVVVVAVVAVVVFLPFFLSLCVWGERGCCCCCFPFFLEVAGGMTVTVSVGSGRQYDSDCQCRNGRQYDSDCQCRQWQAV